MFSDWTFYHDEYKGSLTEEEYAPLARFADAYINAATCYAFAEMPPPAGSSLQTRLKLCACALADEKNTTDNGSGVRTSETVGNHSVSYAVGTVRSSSERYAEVLSLYLSDVVRTVEWV